MLILNNEYFHSLTQYFNNLAHFQNKLNNELDPTCRLWNEAQETFVHRVSECPASLFVQLDL